MTPHRKHKTTSATFLPTSKTILIKIYIPARKNALVSKTSKRDNLNNNNCKSIIQIRKNPWPSNWVSIEILSTL